MREMELCRELSRKICKDLGATPFSIGKVSLTHEDLRVKQQLKLQDEKGLVKNVPLWYGEGQGLNGQMCCLLAALDENPDSLELAFVIGFKDSSGDIRQDSARVGFKYDWSDDADPGVLLVKANDKWLPMALNQRLQLALGLENMVQEGVLWNAQPRVPGEFRENLSEIIEVDG